MTPQERQLINELFDRLATLEGERRDPDAERAIAQGFERAPNAAYALVQTVLVQDEALKRANARIEELESTFNDAAQQGGGGFLESMRNSMLGREPSRGSVPSVRGSSSGGGMGSSGVWNTGQRPDAGGFGGGQASGPGSGWGSRPDAGAPMQAPSPGYGGGGGGSFLGTAAASAAGVIGGAMLLNGIRSMFGPSHSGNTSAFDPGLSGGGRSPWGGDASSSDLAREAGLDDIRGSSRSANSDDGGGRRAGLFGDDQDNDGHGGDDGDIADDGDFGDDGGFDDGGSDTA
jgi:uncharacterized protein